MKLKSDLGISVLVISDLDRFVSLESFWDGELRGRVDDPSLSSCILVEYWKFGLRLGYKPFMMVFLREGGIVGFAPLMMRSRFGFREVSNLDQHFYPDFFSDEVRKICINKLIDFLFKRLNSVSTNLTFEDGSVNQKMLEKICVKRSLHFSKALGEQQALLPVRSNLESFRASLSSQSRRSFRRNYKRIDALGSWEIYDVKIDSNSVKKIWEVEKHSWKNNLKGTDKTIKDFGLSLVLRAVQKNSDFNAFESNVWFLDLNGVTIGYVLVLKTNKTAFFLKTSYDQRFRAISPGKFMINDLIERIFREQTVETIDFMSNLPFFKNWNPIIKNRVVIKIDRNPLMSKLWRFVFKNQISYKTNKFLEDLN